MGQTMGSNYLAEIFEVDNMNIQVLVVTDETLPFVVVVEIVVVENWKHTFIRKQRVKTGTI